MSHPPMALASGQGPTRARNGRGDARMGEYGGHVEAPIFKVRAPMALASGQGPTRARNGRGDARMGEYGGHFWAPVSK
jgi:hypothetical protein